MGVIESLLLLSGSVVAAAIIGLVAYRGISSRRTVAVAAALSSSSNVSSSVDSVSTFTETQPAIVPTRLEEDSTRNVEPAQESTEIPSLPTTLVAQAHEETFTPQTDAVIENSPAQIAENITEPFAPNSAETETNFLEPALPTTLVAEIPQQNSSPAEVSPIVEAIPEVTTQTATTVPSVPEAPPPFPEESASSATTSIPTDVNAVSNIANPTEQAAPVLVIPTRKASAPRTRKRLPSAVAGAPMAPRRKRSPKKTVVPASVSSLPTVTQPSDSIFPPAETKE